MFLCAKAVLQAWSPLTFAATLQDRDYYRLHLRNEEMEA